MIGVPWSHYRGQAPASHKDRILVFWQRNTQMLRLHQQACKLLALALLSCHALTLTEQVHGEVKIGLGDRYDIFNSCISDLSKAARSSSVTLLVHSPSQVHAQPEPCTECYCGSNLHIQIHAPFVHAGLVARHHCDRRGPGAPAHSEAQSPQSKRFTWHAKPTLGPIPHARPSLACRARVQLRCGPLMLSWR
ncbi:hypothetical protein HaLaN_12642, partial [Haematococcus lacustris]